MRKSPVRLLSDCSSATLRDSTGQRRRTSGLTIDALIGERVGERDAHLSFEFVSHQFLRLDEATDLLLAALPAPREVGFGEEGILWRNLRGCLARLFLAGINHVHRSGLNGTRWLRARRFGPPIVPAGAMGI